MRRETIDYLLRGTIDELNVRFMLVDVSNAVELGIKLHDTDPAASFVFAQALTTAGLTTPLLEGTEKHTLRWEYAGEIGVLIAETTADADIRGIPSNTKLSGAADVAELYGESGTISMMRSDGPKILNSGQASAGLLDVPGDIAFFLSTSDQVETEIKVMVGFNPDPENPVAISAGFMVQALPGCDLRVFDELRSAMASENFKTALASKSTAEEAKLRKLMKYLTGSAESAEFHFGSRPEYKCSCDRKKMLAALKTLPKDELDAMLAGNDNPKIKCNFCNTEYNFDDLE